MANPRAAARQAILEGVPEAGAPGAVVSVDPQEGTPRPRRSLAIRRHLRAALEAQAVAGTGVFLQFQLPVMAAGLALVTSQATAAPRDRTAIPGRSVPKGKAIPSLLPACGRPVLLGVAEFQARA